MEKQPEKINSIYSLPGVKHSELIDEELCVEEIQPDEWDLQMMAEAKQENDGNAVSVDELTNALGIVP